jgi:probable phosphoglycerate mutase
VSHAALPEMIWLLRHAETTAPHVFNGFESDVPLSALGEAQAEAVAEWFVPLRPTVVVSSAMTRAIQTAAPIARLAGTPTKTMFELHERKVGAMAGASFSLTEGPWAETLNAWTTGNAHFTLPGAESYADLRKRLLPAWEKLVDEHPGERLVVVAHGIVVKVLLLSLLEGGDPRAWGKIGSIRNVAVTGLRYGAGQWHAEPVLHIPEGVARITDNFPSSPNRRSEG